MKHSKAVQLSVEKQIHTDESANGKAQAEAAVALLLLEQGNNAVAEVWLQVAHFHTRIAAGKDPDRL